jgi:hypothetical protein
MAHFLRPLLGSGQGLGVLVERSQAWLANRLEPAFDSKARKQGLLGRESLPEGHAIVIAPSQGVHTIGMRFPIDIVAVDRQGGVVKVRERVPAWRMVIALSAFAFVELPAGTCARAGLAVGDRLLLASREHEEHSLPIG